MAKDAILSTIEEEIELQKETLEATREANQNIVDKIQEQIDDERQARELEKAEENLTKLQSQ
jgi:hypothetical protein